MWPKLPAIMTLPARPARPVGGIPPFLLTSIPTVFEYLRYEPSPVPRRTERPQPGPAAGRGPPGVPGAGLLRRDPGPDRRRGGLLQGRDVLALRQQGRHVPGPARGPDRRAGRAERPTGRGSGRHRELRRRDRPGRTG